MAILDSFEVSIEIEDRTAQEYVDEDLDATIVEAAIPSRAKYILAEPGKHFAIRMHLNQGYHFPAGTNSLSWEIYVDGQYMEGASMLAIDYAANGRLSTYLDCVRSKRDNRWMEQPLVFWDLDITQDAPKDDTTTSKQRYKKLGIIEVRVSSFFITGLSNEYVPITQAVPDNKTVPEKVLKGRAVTLGAGLGGRRPCQAQRYCTGHRVKEGPSARFYFHYRSKKSLQDLMILPQDDLDNKTIEELKNLLRQQRASQTPVKVKIESQAFRKRKSQADELDDDILEVREVKKTKIPTTAVVEIDSD